MNKLHLLLISSVALFLIGCNESPTVTQNAGNQTATTIEPLKLSARKINFAIIMGKDNEDKTSMSKEEYFLMLEGSQEIILTDFLVQGKDTASSNFWMMYYDKITCSADTKESKKIILDAPAMKFVTIKANFESINKNYVYLKNCVLIN
jgi:hypothetical protein